jgi:hypothetical protein
MGQRRDAVGGFSDGFKHENIDSKFCNAHGI